MQQSSLLRLRSLFSNALLSGIIRSTLPALVFGLSYSSHAQTFIRLGDVTVGSGEIIGNTIYLDSAVAEIKFPIIYGNRDIWSYNVSNAYVIYSDADGIPGDGLPGSRGTGTADWGFPTTNGGNYKFGVPSGPVSGLWIDTTGYFSKSDFGAVFRFNCFGCNGQGADTVIFAGAASDIEQNALRPQDSGVLFDIRVLAKIVDTGKWICIDSATHYPPTNTWKWAPFNCTPSPCENVYPSWSGARCYVIQEYKSNPGAIANCIPMIKAKPMELITYDFNITGGNQSLVQWSVASGVGTIDSLTGVYEVDSLPPGSFPVTVTATDPTGTWSPASCQFEITTSDLAITNCPDTLYGNYCFSTSHDFNAAPSYQSEFRWSILSGVGTIEPVTGLYTTGKLSPGNYSVIVSVIDKGNVGSESSAACSFVLHISGCGISNCPSQLAVTNCNPILHDFDMAGPSQAGVRWAIKSGEGTIDSLTGVYNVSNLPVGTYVITITATETADTSMVYRCEFKVNATECSIANCVTSVLPGARCQNLSYNFDVSGTFQFGVRWSVVSGIGSINYVTGVYTVVSRDSGHFPVTIEARDTAGIAPTLSCSFTVRIFDVSLLLLTCPDSQGAPYINVGEQQSQQIRVNSSCGTPSFTMLDGNLTGATLDPLSGVVTYTGDSADMDFQPHCMSVRIADEFDTAICHVCWIVDQECLYRLAIERTYNSQPGVFTDVDIKLEHIDYHQGLGGFDLLIWYDSDALSFHAASPGAIYQECGWEYFTYRYPGNGSCSTSCPSGLVRLVGIAETNNGDHHPSCQTPKYINSLPITLASLQFLVSNDRNIACEFIPIRFFWIDCGDNMLANALGDRGFLNCHIFDYFSDIPIDEPLGLLPAYTGAPASCLIPYPGHAVNRGVEFHNGGVDIICPDSIDNRGDLNLNGLSYEIADALMFAYYFIYGTEAFAGHLMASRAASDVNSDGFPLTMADLVYLIRVILGDAPPFPKEATTLTATVSTNGGAISITGVDNIGGLFMVLKGEVAVASSRTDLVYFTAFDGVNTRVITLIPFADPGPITGFSGELFSAPDAEIISIDIVDIAGATVKTEFSVPKDFALNQNYPNPFNPATTISFDMPKAGAYKITVYNTTGQKVTGLSGNATAGKNEVNLNLSGNASGVYIYMLEAEGFSATRKAVLLK